MNLYSAMKKEYEDGALEEFKHEQELINQEENFQREQLMNTLNVLNNIANSMVKLAERPTQNITVNIIVAPDNLEETVEKLKPILNL